MSPIKAKHTLLSLLCASLIANPVYSCTTVFSNKANQDKVVARSTDLYVSDSPTLIINPRGISRKGEAGDNSLTWTSKYGNVVVSEFHTNAISDGMNEHGLAVHLLYLSDTDYGARDAKIPALANVMWAQYLLDNFKTVNEAINAVNHFQIVATMVHGKKWPLHLNLQDSSGDSAVIEFIKGKMVVYHGAQYTVMTNEPAFNIQLDNLKRYQSFGGKLALPGDSDPLSRFVRVATYLKTLPAPQNSMESIAGILSVIRTAAVPFGAIDTSGNITEDAWPTRWITIADLTNKTYYFNSTTTPNIIWLALDDLNFSQDMPVLVLDPNKVDLVGDISKRFEKQQ